MVVMGGRGRGGGGRGRSGALGGVVVVRGVGRGGLSGRGAGGAFSPSAAEERAQERGGVGDGPGGWLVGFGGGSCADPPHRRTAGLGAGAADDGALRGERGGVKTSHAPSLLQTTPHLRGHAPFYYPTFNINGFALGARLRQTTPLWPRPLSDLPFPKMLAGGMAGVAWLKGAWLSKTATWRPYPPRLTPPPPSKPHLLFTPFFE